MLRFLYLTCWSCCLLYLPLAASMMSNSSKLKFIGPSTLSLGICSGSMLTLEELPKMWASNSAWLKLTYSWSPSCYKNISRISKWRVCQINLLWRWFFITFSFFIHAAVAHWWRCINTIKWVYLSPPSSRNTTSNILNWN